MVLIELNSEKKAQKTIKAANNKMQRLGRKSASSAMEAHSSVNRERHCSGSRGSKR
jgi:hypothetical protein